MHSGHASLSAAATSSEFCTSAATDTSKACGLQVTTLTQDKSELAKQVEQKDGELQRQAKQLQRDAQQVSCCWAGWGCGPIVMMSIDVLEAVAWRGLAAVEAAACSTNQVLSRGCLTMVWCGVWLAGQVSAKRLLETEGSLLVGRGCCQRTVLVAACMWPT